MSDLTVPPLPPSSRLTQMLQRLGLAGQDISAPSADPTIGAQIVELSVADLKKAKDQGDAGKLVALVNQWYNGCKNVRQPEERQWFKNIDMYQGRQFTIWDKSKKQMVDVPALDYTVRLSVNICEPIVRTEMAKTGANAPTASISPASNDLQDLMAAEAGEAAWEWFYADQKFHANVFSPANWWRTITGIGFIKQFYDPSCPDPAAAAASQLAQQQAARKAVQPSLPGPDGMPAPMPMPSPMGSAFGPAATAPGYDGAQPVPPAAPMPPAAPVLGKIKAEFVSPFNVYIPNPAELDIQKQPYVLHVYTKTVEEAKLAYADRLPEGWNPAPINSNAIVDLSRLGITGGQATVADSVLVMEAWVKPGYTTQLPQGGLVITVADEVVHLANQGLPYAHGDYPFAVLTGIENGKFYRKSVIESITTIQNELNHTLSQIVKRKNLSSAPQFFYDEGSLDPRRITNKPGVYIPIRLGMNRPTAVPIAEVPSYVLNLLDRLQVLLDDVSGQHQISRATAPGADTAASALALLKETDDDFLSTTFTSIESAMETIGRQVLSLMVQFWTEERLVKIVGTESSFDVKSLRGSDLINGTDLRMESGTALPLSKSARIATITDWIDKQIIPAQVGLEAMEMGTLGRLYRKLRVDSDQANRENIEMRDLDVAQVTAFYAQQDQEQAAQAALQNAMQAQAGAAAAGAIPISSAPSAPAAPATPMPAGAPQDPEPFYPIGWQDNDEVHMQVHADYAKGQAFKNLDPAIQRVYKDHFYAHLARKNQLSMVGAQIHGEEIGATMKAEGLQPGLYANTQREAVQNVS